MSQSLSDLGHRRNTLRAPTDTSTLLIEKDMLFPVLLTYAIRMLFFQSVKTCDCCSHEKISLDGHSWKVSSVRWFSKSHILSQQIIFPEMLAEAVPRNAGENLWYVRKVRHRGQSWWLALVLTYKAPGADWKIEYEIYVPIFYRECLQGHCSHWPFTPMLRTTPYYILVNHWWEEIVAQRLLPMDAGELVDKEELSALSWVR